MANSSSVNLDQFRVLRDALMGTHTINIPERMAQISRENARLAKQFIELSRALSESGQQRDAEKALELTKKLLSTNQELIDLSKQSANQ